MVSIPDKKTGRIKSPPGSLVIAVILLTVAFFAWHLYTSPSGPERCPLSCSQFMKQSMYQTWNLGRGEKPPFLGRELAQPKRYSDERAWTMDQKIQRLVNEAE